MIKRNRLEKGKSPSPETGTSARRIIKKQASSTGKEEKLEKDFDTMVAEMEDMV